MHVDCFDLPLEFPLTGDGRGISIQTVDPKLRPNHARTIGILRGMSSDARLRAALELGESSRKLFEAGLRKARPGLSDSEMHRLLLERLDKCHNRNY
jgi:hypothetical protein